MLDQQLIVGSNYRLKFKGAFERHGVCTTSGLSCIHAGNGVFRLEQIASFRDIVLAGVKLYDNFFAPVGVSNDEYQAYFADKPDDEYTPEYTTKIVYDETKNQEIVQDASATAGISVKTVSTITGHEVFVESGKSLIKKHANDKINYANYPIYKFVDVVDSTDYIYVPELTIDGFPEIEINEYKDLHLCFHLGLFDKPELLDPMLLAIRERMAVYGIKPKHIKLYSTGSKWLNPDEYEALRALRVPGNIDTIPEDAKFKDYQGEHIIIGGQIKEIVEELEPGRTDEQVAFADLKSGKAVLDNSLFLEPVIAGDIFNSSKVYYEQVVDTSKNNEVVGWHVMDGIGECPPQEEIMRFKEMPIAWVQNTSPIDPAKRYYIKGYNQKITNIDETFKDKYKAEGSTSMVDYVYYGKNSSGELILLEKVASASTSHRKLTDTEKAKRFDSLTTYYYLDGTEYKELTPVSQSIPDEDLGDYEYKPGITFINSKEYDVYITYSNLSDKQYIAGVTKFRDKTAYTAIYQYMPNKYKYVSDPTSYTLTDLWTCSADAVENKYMAVSGDYVLLAYGEARSNGSGNGSGFMRELTDSNLTEDQIAKDPDKYFWIRTTKIVDGGAEEVVWKTATALEANDETCPIYRKMITTYAVAQPGIAAESLYISVPRFNTVVNVDGTISPKQGPIMGTGIFKSENYVKKDALKLIGTTFEYLNEHGYKKTNVLDLVDIIEFCGKEKEVTMYWSEPSTDAIDRLWEKYMGRRFRYTKEVEYTLTPGGQTYTQSVPIEVVISDDLKEQLNEKTGMIIGQDGTISRSLYFAKDTTLKRNYYLQYTVLKHQFDILQDKYNKLEKHVLAVADKVSN